MFRITQKPKPLVLLILDGWGFADPGPGNAITRAKPSNINNYWFSYPHTFLVASGQAVGLPDGIFGNSEVGHINLGAGRVVFQDLLRLNNAIADGTFFQNEAFLGAVDHATKNNSNIHLMGLVGLGAVHSETSHLYSLLTFLKRNNLPSSKVKIHLFTDGRDSPPKSGKEVIEQIQKNLEADNSGQIASIGGRYYAMDRDNRWDRTEKAYQALIGKSENTSKNAVSTIESSYAQNVTDEFIIPQTIVDDSGVPIGPIKENDAIIFFNYRPDRARQITKAFVLDDLKSLKTPSGEAIQSFERSPKIKNLFFVSLTNYQRSLPVSKVAFTPEEVPMPLSRVFSERNMRQLHIAETEKYAHVTYFFNGGLEQPFNMEERILINSPKVASYTEAPEMSTAQITQKIIEKIAIGSYDFIVANFANADMVGHTGNIDATIKGVQTIDRQIGILVNAVLGAGGGIIITADHGNAEVMLKLGTGEPDTEHNTSPVPALFIFNELRGQNIQLPQGLLADIAPTILGILQIPKPSQMTGRSLL